MRLIVAAASTSLLVLAAACGANGETGEQNAPAVAAGAPLETRPAHGANQQPAFAGQTRLQRQRMVYAALGDIPGGRVHAMAVRATAPGEAA